MNIYMECERLLQLPFEWVEYSCRKLLWMALTELGLYRLGSSN